jgi:hypothetical protein
MKKLLAILVLIAVPSYAANTTAPGLPGEVVTNSGDNNQFGALGNVVREVTTGLSDTTTQTDGLVSIQSVTSGAFTETVSAGTTNGQWLQISDGNNNAATYPVTLVAGPYSSIGGQSSITLSDNSFNIALKWDGLSNWVVTSYYNGTKTIPQPPLALVVPGVLVATGTGKFVRLH